MVEKEEVVGYCTYCKKEIVGLTVNQVLYNLDTHIRAKHKDKLGKKK